MTLRSLLCVSLLALTSVASALPQPGNQPARANRPPTTYPLVVSFISHGAGTSPAAIAQFNVIVAEFEAAWGPLERTVAPWGREGEYDVCFTLTGLWPSAREEIVTQLLALDAEPMTEAAENARCGW
ncbi:MAG TPA: hypothetical protein VLF18_03035 [Tahibacter sp.]|uniref:hypothetical protein n=1 Tax=Tahibacter sp. TaxID=2056211 RepID=UPI002BE95897|nr:hypothetical protein [Tahibacter sp.]HSX59154.1 hypothetical protein [Tahibacter sp.]